MPERRYEFRVVGRLSEEARDKFLGMDITEIPSETVIGGEIASDGEVQDVLTLIQSLGLQVVSVQRAPGPR
jgi:hypothetical protein